jgi:ABC-type spermidine/putrescine transport system permease subunit I
MYKFLLPAILFLGVTFVIPFVMLLATSVGFPSFSLKYYAAVLTDPLYLRVLGTTLLIALYSVVLTVLVSFPIALHLSRLSVRMRSLVIILVLLPFWTSVLVKTYAFLAVLGNNGLVNNALDSIFGIRLPMMFNRTGTLIGMVHLLIPFGVLSILPSLLNQNPDLRRAALIMGATDTRVFWKITLPLAMPGVVVAAMLTMIISVSIFITPALLGGRKDIMISNLIDFNVRVILDWNVAAALSMVLVVLTTVLTVILSRVRGTDPFQVEGR